MSKKYEAVKCDGCGKAIILEEDKYIQIIGGVYGFIRGEKVAKLEPSSFYCSNTCLSHPFLMAKV
jgi:hypothetical protein